MDIQKFFSAQRNSFSVMENHEPREATTKEKIAGFAFVAITLFKAMLDEYTELQEAASQRRYLLTDETKPIRLLGPSFIPSGPVIEGYSPQVLSYVGRSQKDILSEAYGIMRSPYPRQVRIDQLKKLPLQEFGISPQLFLKQSIRRR